MHRVPEGIRLLAEHDIEDLEKIGAQIEQLSEQSLVDQRALKAGTRNCAGATPGFVKARSLTN